MRGEEDVVQGAITRIERGLAGEYIEPGTEDPALAQCRDQRIIDDQIAAKEKEITTI